MTVGPAPCLPYCGQDSCDHVAMDEGPVQQVLETAVPVHYYSELLTLFGAGIDKLEVMLNIAASAPSCSY